MGRDLVASRPLAWRLLRRDLTSRYRRSLLGLLLAFAPALAIAAWATLATRARWINVGEIDLPYPAYVLFSVTLWQAFSEALAQQIEGLAQERPLLSKLQVPPEGVILSRIGEVAFSFAIKMILVAAVFLWYGVALEWTVIFAPAAVAALVLLGTGLGLVLAPLNAFYEDVSKSLPAITTFWFFMTPVVFPLPEHGVLKILVRLNPVTPLLVSARALATGGSLADLPLASAVAAGGVVLTLIGWVLYRLALPLIVERTNA